MVKFDKLGRRIPEFDRSSANKKGAQTKKEKYGSDKHSRDGSLGARKRTRGYFGKLKAEDPDKLREISRSAALKSNEAQKAKSAEFQSETEDDPRGKGKNGRVSRGRS